MALFPGQVVIVKCLASEPNLTITLPLAGKLRNLDRPKDEPLERPLQRIRRSAAPQGAPNRNPKKRAAPLPPSSNLAQLRAQTEPEPPELEVALHEGPTADTPPLDPATTSNAEAWRQGRLLRVGQQRFWVELNPPMVARLEVPGAHFVGLQLCSLFEVQFAEQALCHWQWFRGRRGPSCSRAEIIGGWQAIDGASSRLYTPCQEDLDYLLRVECTPIRRDDQPHHPSCIHASAGPQPTPEPTGTSSLGSGPQFVQGKAASAVCGPVRALPSPLGAQARLALTRQRAQAPQFRVVTYNILADCYASTEVAKTQIFTYCQPQYMAPEFRRPLVVTELLGLQGDVVCLQEVDEKMFTHYLQPQMGTAGYGGFYTNKAGEAREGCALFFRTDRFTLLAQRDLVLKDFFPESLGENSKYGEAIGPMLSTSPELFRTLKRVLTVAQLALLVPKPGSDPEGACRPLCVANTHLFFHGRAPHVRTIHTWAILQEAHSLIQEALQDPGLLGRLGRKAPTLIFCGDLNSSLNRGVPGVIELLHRGRVLADHWDWQVGVGFSWQKGEKGEEAGAAGGGEKRSSQADVGHAEPSAISPGKDVISGLELSIPFALRAADDLQTPFTNYVLGYKGLLDYIWYCPDAVEVAREVPLPSQPQLDNELGGYLPSSFFPSDHLPVVFDLQFKPG